MQCRRCGSDHGSIHPSWATWTDRRVRILWTLVRPVNYNILRKQLTLTITTTIMSASGTTYSNDSSATAGDSQKSTSSTPTSFFQISPFHTWTRDLFLQDIHNKLYNWIPALLKISNSPISTTTCTPQWNSREVSKALQLLREEFLCYFTRHPPSVWSYDHFLKVMSITNQYAGWTWAVSEFQSRALERSSNEDMSAELEAILRCLGDLQVGWAGHGPGGGQPTDTAPREDRSRSKVGTVFPYNLLGPPEFLSFLSLASPRNTCTARHDVFVLGFGLLLSLLFVCISFCWLTFVSFFIFAFYGAFNAQSLGDFFFIC